MQEIGMEDFTLIKVLGRGAFGKVMLCEKKDSKKTFAVKSLRKEDIIAKDQLEYIKTERKILEQVMILFLQNRFIIPSWCHSNMHFRPMKIFSL